MKSNAKLLLCPIKEPGVDTTFTNVGSFCLQLCSVLFTERKCVGSAWANNGRVKVARPSAACTPRSQLHELRVTSCCQKPRNTHILCISGYFPTKHAFIAQLTRHNQ